MVKTLTIPQLLVHKLILSYFKSNGYSESLLQFERESQTLIEEYPPVVIEFRRLIIGGRFDAAEEYISNMQESIGESSVKDCITALRLQKYLEILEGDQANNLGALVVARNALDKLKEFASASLIKDVNSLLGHKSVNDHPNFRDWTVLSGRHKAFEKIFNFLEPVTLRLHRSSVPLRNHFTTIWPYSKECSHRVFPVKLRETSNGCKTLSSTEEFL